LPGLSNTERVDVKTKKKKQIGRLPVAIAVSASEGPQYRSQDIVL
jgi:hypothetical protein